MQTLHSCFKHQPEQRMTVAQLLQHPFVTGVAMPPSHGVHVDKTQLAALIARVQAGESDVDALYAQLSSGS